MSWQACSFWAGDRGSSFLPASGFLRADYNQRFAADRRGIGGGGPLSQRRRIQDRQRQDDLFRVEMSE